MDQVFSDAEALLYQRTKKPPVGLNPERFIAKCELCEEWLHGYEYGASRCDGCQQELQLEVEQLADEARGASTTDIKGEN